MRYRITPNPKSVKPVEIAQTHLNRRARPVGVSHRAARRPIMSI